MKKDRLYRICSVLMLSISLCFSNNLRAQVKVGNNPVSINPNSALEIESVNKGLLLPRLALSSTTSASPMSGFVKGMFVFNTASTNDVTPGIFYCDGMKWIKLASSAATATGVQQHIETVATAGQTIFSTPAPITDINKISLYRNGVLISFSINNANSIMAEIPCSTGDEIRIIQLL